MTPGIRPLVAGNWKMNGTGESLTELRAIAAGLSSDLGRKLDAVICVPATLLSARRKRSKARLLVSAVRMLTIKCLARIQAMSLQKCLRKRALRMS